MYPRGDMNTPFFVHSWFLCQYNQGGSLIHPLRDMTLHPSGYEIILQEVVRI